MHTTPAKHILIAPLDWGLGHTTRCIPIIRHLLKKGHQVTLAGNKTQQDFVRKVFEEISTVHLEGYNIQYSRSKQGFMWSLLRQIPRVLKSIQAEHHWLQDYTRQHPIDGIISDNRYGLYHPSIPTIILTHQLQVQSGLGKWIDKRLPFHYQYLEKFGACWIVDSPEQQHLAGILSHPGKIPGNARYIGLLSQMQPSELPVPETHLLVLLSGPEPQRTILSDILWSQLEAYKGKVVFIEGSASIAPRTNVPGHINYYLQVQTTQLQALLEAASLVVCRSGYSTLMDLALLGKKALLIPTPGQTEQEYLGKHLQAAGVFPCFAQKDFSLPKALETANNFPFHSLHLQAAHQQYIPVLDEWLATLGEDPK